MRKKKQEATVDGGIFMRLVRERGLTWALAELAEYCELKAGDAVLVSDGHAWEKAATQLYDMANKLTVD